MSRAIVVTGATGFMGRLLVERLARRGDAVWAVARTPGEAREGVVWLDQDLSASALPARLPSSIDTVIHLAQSQRFREFPEHARDIFEVNVGSTLRLLDWARTAGARRFVLASSGGIYGHGERGFLETDPMAPQGPLGFYLASKQCAELLAESYTSFFKVVILRFFFVYGAGQRPTMLVPRLVRAVKSGTSITLRSSDGIRLNPTHVSDALAALEGAVALEDSHKVNVGGPEVLTMRQLAETIGELVGRRPCFELEPGEPNHLVGDTTKMARLLAAPATTFKAGVAELCGPE